MGSIGRVQGTRFLFLKWTVLMLVCSRAGLSRKESEYAGEGKGQSPDGRVGQGQRGDPCLMGEDAGQAVDVGAGR